MDYSELEPTTFLVCPSQALRKVSTMSARSFTLSAEIGDYVLEHTTPASPVEDALITETRALGRAAGMQISREQGVLLRTLIHLAQPQLAIEIGTFTGYSALMMAQAFPEGGRLLCCDVSEEWTSIGQRHWEAAGVAERIDLRIAPALRTLEALPQEPQVDFAFIDADKTVYSSYVEESSPSTTPCGPARYSTPQTSLTTRPPCVHSTIGWSLVKTSTSQWFQSATASPSFESADHSGGRG